MWITILIFAIAAVVGLSMAIAAFRGRFPPVPIAVLHGILAASGLVLLLIAVFGHGAGSAARWALAAFLIAALEGFVLALAFHARRKPLPVGLVVGHAALAVAGFLVLLAGALNLV